MIVELPNGQELEFPDDTSQDVMRSAVAKHFPEYAQKEKKKEPKGWSSVLADIFGKASEAPGELWEGLKNIGPQAIEAGKTIGQHPIESTEDIASGLMRGVRGLGNLPSIATEYLRKKGISLPGVEQGRQVSMPFQPNEWEKSISARPGIGHQVLQGGASLVPADPIPGGLPARIAAGGLLSAGQEQNPFTGAAMFALPEAIGKTGKVIKEAPENILANMFKSKLSPEQLQANLRAAKGTNASLGRVLESPGLTGVSEGFSEIFPFGGGKNALGELKEQVQNRAESTLESLKPEGVHGDLNTATKDLLVDAFQEQLKQKNDLYAERNAIADAENFELKTPSFNKELKEISKDVRDSALYRTDSQFRNSINKLSGYKGITVEKPEVKSKVLDARGRPIVLEEAKTIPPSLTDAQMVANKLERMGATYLRSPDPTHRYLGGKYKDVARSLRNDLKSSIETKGSENLKKAQSEADKQYREKFSPFLEDKIYDILQRDSNPQSLVEEIIKPSKTHDKYTDIEKVLNLIPPEKRGVLGYAFLKNRSTNKVGEVNPKDFAKALNSMGKRQFETTFSPRSQKNLLDFGKLQGMSEKALDVMHTPKTGYALKDVGYALAFVEAMRAHPSLGTAVGTASPAILARALNKALTSEKFREKVVKKQIEKKSQ